MLIQKPEEYCSLFMSDVRCVEVKEDTPEPIESLASLSLATVQNVEQ